MIPNLGEELSLRWQFSWLVQRSIEDVDKITSIGAVLQDWAPYVRQSSATNVTLDTGRIELTADAAKFPPQLGTTSIICLMYLETLDLTFGLASRHFDAVFLVFVQEGRFRDLGCYAERTTCELQCSAPS